LRKRLVESIYIFSIIGISLILYIIGIPWGKEENSNTKNALIQGASLLKYNVFNTSALNSVIAGEDGFLFYSETLKDYQNIATISKRELFNINRTLFLMQEYTKEKGGKFLFTVAPNKNSIYDYMPYNYIKLNSLGNYELLSENMGSVNNINLFNSFKEQKEILYFKKDTHWNNLGAFLSFKSIMKNFNLEYPFYENIDFEKRRDFQGDLSRMLNPLYTEYEDDFYAKKAGEYEFLTRTRSVTQSYIESYNKNRSDSLLMFRDSFGNALVDFFSNSFNYVIYDKKNTYDLLQMDKYNTNHVLILIAERNIPLLTSIYPLYYAPIRENLNTVVLNKKDYVIEITEMDDFYEIKGYLKKEDISPDTRIYFKTEDYIYELSPQNYKDSEYGFYGIINAKDLSGEIALELTK